MMVILVKISINHHEPVNWIELVGFPSFSDVYLINPSGSKPLTE